MTNDGEQREGAADRSVTSQLTIRHVTDVDSGNYTCAPSNAEPASTMVYVSEGNFIFFFFSKWLMFSFSSIDKSGAILNYCVWTDSVDFEMSIVRKK